ncbi:MAG: GNAT family N-acetyltransferase [Actinomycetota bacterium]|nr:GNAT family N-acetyltransferase [Actinomycetota bacterium]
MTVVGASVRPLGDADRQAVADLVAADHVGQCVFEARLGTAASLQPWDLGGQVWGVETAAGLRAACYAGGTLVPLGGEPADLRVLAASMARQRRTWSSIVGRAEAVHAFWPEVGQRWGQARAVRADQPLLATTTRPPVAADPLVVRATPRDLPRYLPASLAMFSEELDLDAPDAGVDSPYRRRVAALIGSGLAFVRFDERGRVMFKAEIVAVSAHCCQIQGVWVEPARRGRGLGTAAVAAVLEAGLRLAPVVSLYVNDFNAPARRVYERLGLRQVGSFATVLF